MDPLSEFALEMDPLSRAAMETVSIDIWIKKIDSQRNYHFLFKEDDIDSKSHQNEEHHIKMEPWSARKLGILSKYTTSEKLCIISFLPDGEKGN